MNTTLIRMFNAALVENKPTVSDFQAINSKALKLGYLIPQEICNESVKAFLEEQTINPNATFYKSFKEVTDKSRLGLLFDQIMHYMTTYGTDFSCGNGYVPNDGETPLIPFENYKVISVIDPEELFSRCCEMICSGIALKQETMVALVDYIVEFFGENPKEAYINVNDVKNKEAQIYLCSKLGIYPTNANDLLRYILYTTTRSTMIIKNKSYINSIINSDSPFDFSKLTETQMIALSSIFLRYKPLFLAFKHNIIINNTVAINKLRRLAIKNHKPMQSGFWQNVFNVKHTAVELGQEVNSLTNYKKVALMQICLEKLDVQDNQFYLIRNQKAFLREGYKPEVDTTYVMLIYSVLHNSLVESLKTNSTTTELLDLYVEDGNQQKITREKIVRMKSDVEIALPTSEKSFIGNYPFGTTFPLTNNNYIGIYWRNEWGTRDFDLSLIDENGSKIGWNSNYYNDEKDIIYSGDMTNASPEAAEVIYIKKNDDLRALIKVNQFNGEPISKYKFYFGQDKISRLHENYMVDPNTIKLATEVPVDGIKEQTIGVIAKGKAILMAINTGNLQVSAVGSYMNIMMDAIEHKSSCFVMAKDILSEAGYKVVDETYEGKVDIDFAEMQKDTIISLMK